MGDTWLVSVLREPVTPGYLALLVAVGLIMRFGPAIMAAFNERHRDRAKITGEEWDRMREEIGRLADETKYLREKINECEDDRIVWMHRAVKAEAALMGEGDAKQTAQRTLSAERLADRAKKAREGGDGEGI